MLEDTVMVEFESSAAEFCGNSAFRTTRVTADHALIYRINKQHLSLSPESV